MVSHGRRAGTCLGAVIQSGLHVCPPAKAFPKNDAEAVDGIALAAEQGLANAQSNLGVMYPLVEGVPQIDAEAVRWYRNEEKAAEQGLNAR